MYRWNHASETLYLTKVLKMPSPKIAVITPYYKEPTEMLMQCHESVARQGENVDHFMIADGFPNEEVARWPVKHVALPAAHGDNGNTPRAVGSLLAINGGYDYIAYLDADNWFHDGHLASLLATMIETKADVATCFRTFHDLEGNMLDVFERAEDKLKHVDTSCFLIGRAAFPATMVWGLMPKPLSPSCDRVFLGMLKHNRYRLHSTRSPSVAFRTQYAVHYKAAHQPIPPNAKKSSEFDPVLNYLKSNEGVAECVRLLGFWPYHYF